MYYELPIIPEDIAGISKDDIIQMDKLNFDDVEYLQKERTALLFIRNTGILASYDFSKCSYESKEKFLMLYLNSKISNLNIDLLASTWVKIICKGYIESFAESILSDEEIETFTKNNSEFIYECRRFVISIPICVMAVYEYRNHGSITDLSEYETSTYEGFNPYSFSKLFDYQEIVMLPGTIEDITPLYYDNYFNIKNTTAYLSYPKFINDIFNKFPYMGLIDMIIRNDEVQINDFANRFKEALAKQA
jgi:hypothetical protein